MKNFKTSLTLLVMAFFAMGLSLSAQDSPPEPKSQTPESLKQDQEKEQAQPESKSDSQKDKPSTEQQEPLQEPPKEMTEQEKADDNKQADDKKADDEKADDEKAEDKKAEDKKAEDKKAEDKKADDKKADDKKADDKKAEDKKADDKKADQDKQADDKPTNNRSLANALGMNPWSRDKERIDSFSKKSDGFVSVFDSVVASANASTLQVMSGKRQIALGTVIDSDGYVLTKASELRGQLGCKLLDGTILEAKVIGIDPETDLALLKVDAENLNVIQWSQDPTPEIGQWVATPKAEKDLATIGVISVDARIIPPSKPFIGITMDDFEDGGVRITSVVLNSPAENADLNVNDVILKIDDAEIEDITKLRKELEQYDINDRVTLTIRRRKEELKIKLTLAERDKVSPENVRSNQQNSMGSILSRRRKNFPSSFQHDSMLNSKTCGGPIVDLSGKVVGINIARAGRVSSLALTAATVQPVIARLKSGNLAPAVVNKLKIEQIDAELKEIDAKLGTLPENKNDLERKYNVEKARMEELEKSMEDLKNRMKVIDEKATEYKSELDAAKNELRKTQRIRQRLEEDRKQLATGSR